MNFGRSNGSDLIKAPDGFARVFAGKRETPALGTLALLEGYNSFPWIRAISDKIGHGIGSTKWELSAGDLEIDNHPMLDLLKRPNPAMSGMAFFKWSGTVFALTNEIFWMIERNAVGMPIELWPIPPHWVVDIPKFTADGGEYELSFGGVRTRVPEMDVIYIRDFSPANPYGRSSSPAKALGDEIESNEFASKYVKSFFMNSARPDLLIYSDDKDNPLDKESAERLEQSWLDKLQGFRKRFKPFFLPGKVGVKDLQSDLRSMDLVQQQKFWRDVTLQVYGIPPEALGIIENSNRATISAAEFFLTKHVIVPRLDIIKDGLSVSLAPQFDQRLSVGYVSPVKEDQEHNLKVTTAHPHAFTLDEIRSDAGKEDIPDGKGNIYPYMFNTLYSEAPGGGNVDVERTPAPAPAPAPVLDEPESDDKRFSKTLSMIKSGMIVKVISDDQIEEILIVMGSDEFNPSVGLANREAVAAFGQSVVDQVSTGVDFEIASSEVEGFLAEQSGDRITGLVNEGTKNDLRKTLSQGSALGEGADQLATRIAATFDNAKDFRAFRIARTESVRASNFGSLSGMKQMGIKQKQWLTVGDSNTRESHQVMNGQVVDTANQFRSGAGFQTAYPGGFGIAAEDIECRCSILAVIAPEGASIDVPSKKDFEREQAPYKRLMEHAYIRGFEAQEKLIIKAFNLTQEN